MWRHGLRSWQLKQQQQQQHLKGLKLKWKDLIRKFKIPVGVMFAIYSYFLYLNKEKWDKKNSFPRWS